MAERHRRLWDWFASLRKGFKPPAHVEIWGRGGAKSSTAEGGTTYVAESGLRKYILYVSCTQDQADKHVAAVSSVLESRGVDRALNKYGNSKGWRRNQLRCANGSNIEGLGLDVAARGIKLDEYRPDLIILDDIDEREDTPEQTAKKIRSLTQTIIPAGSTDCAVLFIQNMIIEDGIAAQLCDGRADFLLDRNKPYVEPAVVGLEWERVVGDDNMTRYRIVKGEATWEGQDLKTCEAQMNEWGLSSFLRESQHEVQGADGYYYNVEAIRYVDTLPNGGAGMKLCRAWDFGATQQGGDPSAGCLHAYDPSVGAEYCVNVVTAQLSSGNLRTLIKEQARLDVEKYGPVTYRFPQDPAQAGKDQAEQLDAMMRELKAELEAENIKGLRVEIKPVSGRKSVRGRGLSTQIESGNFFYCEDTMRDCIEADKHGYVRVKKDGAHWHREELRKFREDEKHLRDDQADASADAHNEIWSKPTRTWADALALMD